MEIGTSRFGTIRLQPADKLCFPAGLPGFEDCRDWVLLVEGPHDQVGWLQSATWPEIALPVVNPTRFENDYQLRTDRQELAPLGLDNCDDLQVLAIVGSSDEGLTLNLKAPVAINMRRRLGRQIIHVADWSPQHIILRSHNLLRKSA